MRFSRRQFAVGLGVLIGLAGWMWPVSLAAANQTRSPLQAIESAHLIAWAASLRFDQPSNCDKADVNGDGAINIADVAFVGLRTDESRTLDLSVVALIGVCYGASLRSAAPITSQLPASMPLPESTRDLSVVNVSVSPRSSRVSLNQVFDISVTLSTTVPTRAAQFGMSFNPAVLRCDSISEGPFYRDWAQAHGGTTMLIPAPTCNNAQGAVTDMGVVVIGSPTGGPQGSGVVAQIRFAGLADGLSPLNLIHVQVIDAGSTQLSTSTLDGQALVGSAPGTQSVNVSVDASVRNVNNLYLPLVMRSAPGRNHILYFPLIMRSAPGMIHMKCSVECGETPLSASRVSDDIHAIIQWVVALTQRRMVVRHD
jgi:hypothetical protein